MSADFQMKWHFHCITAGDLSIIIPMYAKNAHNGTYNETQCNHIQENYDHENCLDLRTMSADFQKKWHFHCITAGDSSIIIPMYAKNAHHGT